MSSWLSEAIRTTSNNIGDAIASSPHRQQMIDLRAAYRKALDEIRGDISLSELGKQQLMARAWTNTRAELARLTQLDFDTHVARYDTLEKSVFGTTATSGADAVSARDADDRAGRLDNAESALDALLKTERNSDPVLARAIVLRAWEMGWDTVVDRYAITHPKVTSQLAELGSLKRHLTDRASKLGGNIAGGGLPRPTELDGLSLAQINEYGSAEPTLSATYLLANKHSLNISGTTEMDLRQRAVEEARARAARGE